MNVCCVIELDSLADWLDSFPTIWESGDAILFLELVLEKCVSRDSAIKLIDLVGKAFLLRVVGHVTRSTSRSRFN